MPETYISIESPHITNANHKIDKLNDDYQIETVWPLTNDEKKLEQHLSNIVKYYEKFGLSVGVQKNIAQLRVKGSAKNISEALQIQLCTYKKDNDVYYSSSSPIKIPSQWEGVIHNVIGLNTEKIFKPYYCKFDAALMPRASSTFTPLQLATLYRFPTGLDGTGQKVGIIELGGGYVMSDIVQYFANLSISGTPNVTSVSVDGGSNDPNDQSGANLEVVLDIEVIAALVPKAAIFVYFAPNTYLGFYDAIQRAILDGCKIISISWGAPEAYWSPSYLTLYNTLFQTGANNNVSIYAASGDNGSSDGLSGNNVDFPASSQYVIGCGGTTLQSTDGNTISSEVIWSGSGGGVSQVFSTPSYQSDVKFALNGKRGVPDICGVANPSTGYILYSASEGGTIVVGGTSAVAPLWSGLTARLNQSLNRPLGFISPTVYTYPGVCLDITQGNNGTYTGSIGWDPCTGNGSPNGTALLNLLTNTIAPVAAFTGTPLTGIAPLTVSFTDQSSGSPISYLWSFGDSKTSTLKNPTNIYSVAGIYTVSLTVTNGNGNNTLIKTNYINVAATNLRPVANFTGSPTNGRRPLTVFFTDRSTNNPTRWQWTFGDTIRNTSSLRNPQHTYSRAGTYNVRLIASNSFGSTSMTKNSYVVVSNSSVRQRIEKPVPSVNPKPRVPQKIDPKLLIPVSFKISKSETNKLMFSFTDTSTNSPKSWSWNFGDGKTSSEQNPTHEYVEAKIYKVTLTTKNNSPGSLMRSNYVYIECGTCGKYHES